MPHDTRYRPNSPPVLHETIDHETIIVNLDVGTYYSLNRAATSIWTLLDSGASIEQIVETLAEKSGTSQSVVDQGVRVFLEQLIAEQLVVGREQGQTPAELDGWPEGLRFEAPVLSTYTDMQELLLLDPVHDVGIGGWAEQR
jgi:Coenzyme PQQ synthesis protein D (PqqD)